MVNRGFSVRNITEEERPCGASSVDVWGRGSYLQLFKISYLWIQFAPL